MEHKIFLSYALTDPSLGTPNVSVSNEKQLTFEYPCDSTFKCTDYNIIFEPGVYQIELYGASGGYYENFITAYQTGNFCLPLPSKSIKTNVECKTTMNNAGSGGYTSGIIKLRYRTNAFLSIGGKGQYGYKQLFETNDESYLRENMLEGGYNGGGWASNFYRSSGCWGCGSGGGATDLKFDVNDVFHRVLVAGAGGGSDDQTPETYLVDDNGAGGCGGGLVAQSFTIANVEDKKYQATQISGFWLWGVSAKNRKS